jgi:hypothetical protein
LKKLLPENEEFEPLSADSAATAIAKYQADLQKKAIWSVVFVFDSV